MSQNKALKHRKPTKTVHPDTDTCSNISVLTGDTWLAFHIWTVEKGVSSLCNRLIAVQKQDEKRPSDNATVHQRLISLVCDLMISKTGQIGRMCRLQKTLTPEESSHDEQIAQNHYNYWQSIDQAVKWYREGQHDEVDKFNNAEPLVVAKTNWITVQSGHGVNEKTYTHDTDVKFVIVYLCDGTLMIGVDWEDDEIKKPASVPLDNGMMKKMADALLNSPSCVFIDVRAR